MTPEEFNRDLRSWVKRTTGRSIGNVDGASRTTWYKNTHGERLLPLPELMNLVRACAPDVDPEDRADFFKRWSTFWRDRWHQAQQAQISTNAVDARLSGPEDPDGLDTVPERRPSATRTEATALRTAGSHDRVEVIRSSAVYHARVVELESTAEQIDYIQYRVSPYFLPDQAVQRVADQRFGRGNPFRNEYIESQGKRRDAFYQLLSRDVAIRELYPRDRLQSFVANGTHSAKLWPLEPQHVVDALLSWREAILLNDNYDVAITDEAVPLKYHVLDRNLVALHEPIGKGDAHRLCAVFFTGGEVGEEFLRDFDLIWGLTDPEWRDPHHVARWIETELVPLALVREGGEDGRRGTP